MSNEVCKSNIRQQYLLSFPTGQYRQIQHDNHLRYTCQSKPTRLTRVGSPRAGLKMSELNPAHFMVS